MKIRKYFLYLVFLISMFTLTPTWAQSPNNQPIHIVADSALRDEKQGLTLYTGNVKMEQGNLVIDADRISIVSQNDEVTTITAHGQPAHFFQGQTEDQMPVTGYGNTIEYQRSEERIHLQEQASIEQNGSTVKGDSILYFINERLVKADSSQSDRVEVVIPPRIDSEEVQP